MNSQIIWVRMQFNLFKYISAPIIRAFIVQALIQFD